MTGEVIQLEAADFPCYELEGLLCRIFDQDPHFNWLVRQDGQRQAAMRRLFRQLLQRASSGIGRVNVAADFSGAAIWYPPHAWPLPLAEQHAFFLEYLQIAGFARAIRRGIGLKRMDARHPQSPHCYLQVIGVAEDCRRRGAGADLLQPMLAVCDKEGIGGYLETANSANLAFYAKWGFDVVNLTHLAGGLHLWSLLRETDENN